jgi:hypothetical protein
MTGVLASVLLQSASIPGLANSNSHIMTAIKKTNTKTKSPAPATGSTTKSTKKKASSHTNGSASASALAMAPIQPAGAPVNPLPTVKPVASARVQTKIVAKVDVGFGNALYVRGDGPGLSWNQGVRMNCVANDQWELSLGESARPVSFKLLLNDTIWCSGPDSTVASGATATVTPDFA